ncbi:MAG TPA: hypothetical protein PLF81_31180, partial [Candidatus Anammoximicrobium sp.]|nr:hypothetical protein [Candidatus Anammoximicrobium sp.]
YNSAVIETTSGNMRFDGRTATGAASAAQYGMYVGFGSNLKTTDGAIDITTTVRATTNSSTSYGIYFSGGSITGGSGAVTVNASGGTGGSAYGVYQSGGSISTTSGDISLTGSGSTRGIYQSSGTITAGGGSNLTLTADTVSLGGTLSGTGNLLVQPKTAGTTIGIAGGTGTLQLTAGNFSTNFANGFSSITVGNAAAGNIILGDGTAVVNVNYNDPLTLKTAGNITLNSDASLNGAAAGADGIKSSLVLWADADNSGQGFISLGAGSGITTNGGKIILAGGLDDGGGNAGLSGLTAGDGIPDGYAKTTAAASSAGVLIGQPGGGGSSVNLLSGGGEIVVRGQGLTSDGLGITSQGTFRIDSGAGSITMLGKSAAGHGVEFGFGATPNWAITSSSTSSNAVYIKGTTGSTSGNYAGLWLGNKNTGNILIQATGAGGGVTLLGESADTAGLKFTNSGATDQILSQSGSIHLTGYSAAGTDDFVSGGTLYVGNRKDETAINGVTPGVTDSSADITLTTDSLTLSNESTFASRGTLTIKPYTANTTIGIAGGSGTLQLADTFFSTNLADGFSSITVGNDTAGKITAGAISPKDNLTLQSGSGGIELTGTLNAGANTVTLNSTGSVTDTGSGAITANSLALLGSGGSFTLDYPSNNVGTLAANTGNVVYVDSDALTIGSVGATSGLRTSD